MQTIVIAKLAVYTEAANHSGYMKIIKVTTAIVNLISLSSCS